MNSGFYAKRPWYHPLALIRRVMNYYLLFCIMLFVFQNKLLFPNWMTGAVMSRQQAAAMAAQYGLVAWNSPTPGAASPQGYVRSDFAQPSTRGTIVVFHGNGNCAFDREYYVDAFSQRGFRTFLYEYPGYGGRPGSPSAGSIVGDARTLIRSLALAGYGPIYIWGESIGSGIAAAVCQDPTLPVHGLTLSSPWDSLTHAAEFHYPIAPISVLLWDNYDSIANLKQFSFPICVICGTDDPVVPVWLSLNLYAHLPGTRKLFLKQGYGHGDWPISPGLAWWDEALDFIALKTP